jgi:hypothetical protein
MLSICIWLGFGLSCLRIRRVSYWPAQVEVILVLSVLLAM